MHDFGKNQSFKPGFPDSQGWSAVRRYFKQIFAGLFYIKRRICYSFRMYDEEQKFSFPFLVGVCIFIVGSAILIGSTVPAVDRVLAIFSVASPVLIIFALYHWFRLRTTVVGDKLSVKLSPFGGTEVALSDIRSAKVVQYRPIRDFGGWGIRFGRKGRMYNARGNQAVQLIVNGSGTIFVGSQTPEKLAAILSARQ